MDDEPKLVHKPPDDDWKKVKGATLGVKFSNDVFLSESFLVRRSIQYEQSDLEMTPFGMCHRLKKDKKDMLNNLPEKSENGT
jgi:hypothetical protein